MTTPECAMLHVICLDSAHKRQLPDPKTPSVQKSYSSLSDLTHQVPRLLELMPSECLAALIATSTTHRRQVHDCVTSITLSHSAHASHLISCRWPRLVKWTIADQDSYMLQNIYVTCDMTVAAASVLAKVSMLRKWRLQLDCLQLTKAIQL